ncbi:MAG: DMT family transporter [Lachnospiraceae bacterium]|nr:DMT family transporter [Lachnospiraceae bacterium]
MTKRMRGNVLLLLAAFIWGLSFVAQSEGMKYIGPFAFIGIRSMLAGVSLAVFLGIRAAVSAGKKRKETNTGNVAEDVGKTSGDTKEAKLTGKKTLLLGGVSCGIILFAATMLQQIGILHNNEPGKAGFITALYLILVPLAGIFFRKKIGAKVWIAVVLAVCGMYLLCITEGLHMTTGDLYLLGCAFVFTLHILVIDYFSPKVDGVAMSCIQFLLCGALGMTGMFLTETVELSHVLEAWLPLVFSGVFSGGVAYTLQIVAQKDTEPAIASLLMSLESVFAVFGEWLILGQLLSAREFAGCGLMFAGILLTQLPEKKRGKQAKI